MTKMRHERGHWRDDNNQYSVVWPIETVNACSPVCPSFHGGRKGARNAGRVSLLFFSLPFFSYLVLVPSRRRKIA